MPLKDEEKEKKEIDVLLSEYQACHRNRNHYDSIRWTIGSIFIATSLTLFGISFLKEVRESYLEVLLIAVFSLVLMLIWYGYNQHVNPYVIASIVRSHEIERELRDRDFDIRLHYLIGKQTKRMRGAWITYFLFLVVLGVWFFRMTLFFQEFCLKVVIILMYVVSAVIVYVIHMRILNATDWGKEIEKIIKNT